MLRLLLLALLALLAPGLSSQDHPRSAGFPKGYYSGDPLPPATLYLTFDDGPAENTAAILDILLSKGVRATFFINSFNRKAPPDRIGRENNLLAYQEVLQRMVREGHVLGNHSFSHRDLGTLTTSQIVWQLDTVQKNLDEALGAESPRLTLIRPPFGSPWLGTWNTLAQRERVASVIETRGFVMNWTRSWDSGDSMDWVPGEAQRLRDPQAPASAAYLEKVKRVQARLLAPSDGQTGGILLFHDNHPTSRDVLSDLIDTYRAAGYTYDTLDHYAQWRWGPDAFNPFR